MENNILSKEEIINLYKLHKHNLCNVLKSIYPYTYNFINTNFAFNKELNKCNNTGKNKFTEKIYKYVYGESGKCIKCKECSTTFRSFSEGYMLFCSQKCRHLYISEQNGVSNIFQLESVKNKIKQTCIKKYGVTHPNKSSIFKDKIKNTKLQRYGNENYNNKEKMIQTCIKKYNVSNPNKLNHIKIKIKNSHLKKYGGMGFGSTQTMLKIKNTTKNRYGSESAMQNDIIFIKNQKASHKFKKYIFPSGKIENVQGYEPFAINILLKTYKEDDIIVNRKDIPKFKYEYNGSIHKYYPDIYIKSENLIIEIKSIWTVKLHPFIDELKKQTVINNGYNFKKMIFDNKGNLNE